MVSPWLSVRSVPAIVRLETASVGLCKLVERLKNVFKAAFAGIIHRTTTERSKTGPENHGTIHRCLILNHLLSQASHAGIQHGEDQSVQSVVRGAAWRVF